MYPIKVYFVRVHRGDLHYAWHDEGMSPDGDLTHAKEAEIVARHIAEVLWLRDPDEARVCIKDPGQLRNLLDFTHPPNVRFLEDISHPQTLGLNKKQEREFLILLQRTLEALGTDPNNWGHMNP